MEIVFYREKDGSFPVQDFLDGLENQGAARIMRYLTHLADSGGRATGSAYKKLHGYPLEEIRVKQSRTLHRVIIHVKLKDKILVLHGFTKVEGQETPKKELEQALARYKAMTATHGESKRHE